MQAPLMRRSSDGDSDRHRAKEKRRLDANFKVTGKARPGVSAWACTGRAVLSSTTSPGGELSESPTRRHPSGRCARRCTGLATPTGHSLRLRSLARLRMSAATRNRHRSVCTPPGPPAGRDLSSAVTPHLATCERRPGPLGGSGPASPGLTETRLPVKAAREAGLSAELARPPFTCGRGGH